MPVSIRRGRTSDAATLGDICYRAFKTIAEEHNFPADVPNPEVAAGLLGTLIEHDRIYDVVAEVDGRIAGSNFLDERNPIGGVGPITIDPARQNDGVGRELMCATLERSAARGFVGVRLVQAAYHRRSFALYLKLGFDVRELLICLQGTATPTTLPGFKVRAATADDLSVCNRLCTRVHGHARDGELADTIAQGSARVVERAGRITGYATPIAYFGHAVAETNDDLKALISGAESIPGPGVLVPARNGDVIRWCLDRGLRVTQMMTLMTMGLYNEPQGPWLPSVIY
jgi:GNAT superfamily N-acetyltransferase